MTTHRHSTNRHSGLAKQPRPPERACRCDPRAGPTCALRIWRPRQVRNYICGRARQLFHKDMDALPFCHLRLSAIKPTRYGFQGEPKTLGDHIRKRRLELGLRQRDVARDFAVTVDTLRNWERNRTLPLPKYIPRILRLLGYDPRPAPTTLVEHLLHHKELHGLTQESFAKILGIDESTLSGWSAGRHRPSKKAWLNLRRTLQLAAIPTCVSLGVGNVPIRR